MPNFGDSIPRKRKQNGFEDSTDSVFHNILIRAFPVPFLIVPVQGERRLACCQALILALPILKRRRRPGP